MELPFSGMDPYLELPALWPDVHARIISAMRDAIQEQLGPNYVALITPYIALESIEIAPTRQVFVPGVGVFRDEPAGTGTSTATITPAHSPFRSRSPCLPGMPGLKFARCSSKP